MAEEARQVEALEEAPEHFIPVEEPMTDAPPESEVARPARAGDFSRYAGWIGVFAAVIGIAAVLAATALCGTGCGTGSHAENSFAPDGSFSWSSNALSDLGVSQVRSLFNYSLIAVGILNLVFAVGFVRAYARGPLFYVGGVLVIAGGASLSLVGTFTEETGGLHSIVSLGYFLLFPFGMILVGVAFLRTGESRMGYGSVLLGLLALVVILSSVVTRWHASAGVGFAVPEIIEAFAIAAWIVWMGLTLARSE